MRTSFIFSYSLFLWFYSLARFSYFCYSKYKVEKYKAFDHVL